MSARNDQQELTERILSFKYDPVGFVLFAYPWGVKNTPLERFTGPRSWQLQELQRIKEELRENRIRLSKGNNPLPIYLSISSGRGTGKSAFLAWLSDWLMSCWVGGTCIVAANTEAQLRSRTMAEKARWNGMLINCHWFDRSTTKITPSTWFAKILGKQLRMDTQYYYTEGQTWNEENPDAFAGAHSQIAMMLQFDEASGIPDPIWAVSEGFFTDLAELRLWIVISNPRRNTGMFFNTFHDNAAFWMQRYIDSRSVEGTDQAQYQRIADMYGEDSDVTRVEVQGRFPRKGSNQFISREVVQDAISREVAPDSYAALIMGVDVARFGEDESVIRLRHGRDARSIPRLAFKGIDTMELAREVATAIDRYKPEAVFIDGGGVGGGVIDRLRELRYHVIEVQFGSRAKEPERYLNKRSEMWGLMRDWLVRGCIDDFKQLELDLTGPEYNVNDRDQLCLEKKKDMKKRGLTSPDDGDALALTFAEPVASQHTRTSRHRRPTSSANIDYEIYGGLTYGGA